MGYGLPQADLIQEGNIGLMKAVKRFDPERGVRLVSFAMHWIRAEIHEFVLRNWRIVKIATTKAQRKLFFNLRSMKQNPGTMGPEDVNAMARQLGVRAATWSRWKRAWAAATLRSNPLIPRTRSRRSRRSVIWSRKMPSRRG